MSAYFTHADRSGAKSKLKKNINIKIYFRDKIGRGKRIARIVRVAVKWKMEKWEVSEFVNARWNNACIPNRELQTSLQQTPEPTRQPLATS